MRKYSYILVNIRSLAVAVLAAASFLLAPIGIAAAYSYDALEIYRLTPTHELELAFGVPASADEIARSPLLKPIYELSLRTDGQIFDERYRI